MQDVAALGFEGEVGDEDIFISAANRALALIYSDRAVTRDAVISYEAPSVLSYVAKYRHTGGKEATFKLPGTAYSFKSSGTGFFTVEDGYKSETHELVGNMSEHRGFLSSEASITFFGEYSFTVYHLASFESRVSGEVSDVAIYDGRESIDVAAMLPDFLSFSALPRDSAGRSIEGVSLREGLLLLPDGFRGEIYLTYRCAPGTLSLFSPDATIDVPRDMEPLLPLLTASFMWLDDDSDKAEYYMALYRESLSGVLRYHNREISTDYITNGWA